MRRRYRARWSHASLWAKSLTGPRPIRVAPNGNVFVAENRAKRTGYKVVRVVMLGGAPTGEYENFATGFVGADRRVWGRPIGVAAMRDGSILIGEDEIGTIWRIMPGRGAP